jgi:hypothetical protein
MTDFFLMEIHEVSHGNKPIYCRRDDELNTLRNMSGSWAVSGQENADKMKAKL